MEFLGIGPLELLVVVLLALIIFSPKDIVKGGRSVGRFLNQLNRSDTWKSMQQMSKEMQNLPGRLAREAQLEEIQEIKELQKDLSTNLEVPAEKESPPRALPPAAANPYAEKPQPPNAGVDVEAAPPPKDPAAD